MAASKPSSHTRSLSLPSTSHPLNASIKNHFRILRASQAGPSSSLLCQNLCNTKDLYQQMDSLINLPHKQQILSYEYNRKEVEGVLDGSFLLLDTSGSALDALSQMKESILDLKSALRRGSIDEGIPVYMKLRETICKALSKCLANLKKAEKNRALPQSDNVPGTVKMLKEAEAISLPTLKSLLLYAMGKSATSQAHGWSLVARLVKAKHASSDAENNTEVVHIDQALNGISESHSSAETMVVLKKLEILEKVILELEDGLESISRCFVKIRVSLLNVLKQ